MTPKVLNIELERKIRVDGKEEWKFTYEYTFENGCMVGSTPSPQFLQYIIEKLKAKEGLENVIFSDKAKEYFEKYKDTYIPHFNLTFEEALGKLDDPYIFKQNSFFDEWIVNDIKYVLKQKLSEEEIEKLINEKEKKALEVLVKNYESQLNWYFNNYLTLNEFEKGFENFKDFLNELNLMREKLGMKKIFDMSNEELKNFVWKKVKTKEVFGKIVVKID